MAKKNTPEEQTKQKAQKNMTVKWRQESNRK